MTVSSAPAIVPSGPGLSRGEHPAVEPGPGGPDLAGHLVGPAAEVGGRGHAVHVGQPRVDAAEAPGRVDVGQADRGGGEERVEEADGLPRIAVQAGVVDGQRAAVRQADGEVEVGRAVVAALGDREHGERAEDPVAGEQGDDHV
jgi:hypothetical protein